MPDAGNLLLSDGPFTRRQADVVIRTSLLKMTRVRIFGWSFATTTGS